MSRHLPEIRLRPVTEADLGMFRRFVVEPGLIGLDWSGFRDPKAVQRRFDTDSYLGEDNGRLIVDVAAGTEPGREPAGLVSYQRRFHGTQASCWEIGIALLPEWRGRGIGWRAQAIFCSYLFENTPVQRIEAATHAENASEQRSLEKAGFTLEGVIRAAEFRAGEWRDCYLYSRLRTDPDPLPQVLTDGTGRELIPLTAAGTRRLFNLHTSGAGHTPCSPAARPHAPGPVLPSYHRRDRQRLGQVRGRDVREAQVSGKPGCRISPAPRSSARGPKCSAVEA